MSRLPTRHKLDIQYASISRVMDWSGDPDPTLHHKNFGSGSGTNSLEKKMLWIRPTRHELGIQYASIPRLADPGPTYQ